MSWAKVDDKLFLHPKFLGVSFAARGLWITALSWCAAMETDGFIPLDAIRSLCGRMRARDRLRLGSELVAARLWERVNGGYQFHDFLDHNPSSKDLKLKRKSEAARLREYRARTHVRTEDRTSLPARPDPTPKALASLEPARRRSRTLPAGEALTAQRLAIASAEGLTEEEARKEWRKMATHEFRDPHSDWTRVFREWCLRSREYGAARSKPAIVQAPGRVVPGVEATRQLLAKLGRPVP